MPLDSTDFVIETKPDLSKPSLEGLSWLLQHLSTELPTHKYEHYHFATAGKCGTAGCAYGICQIVWPDAFPPDLDIMEGVRADRIFGRNAYVTIFSTYAYRCSPWDVTPQMVADRIDAYLAETRK